jgi:type I restriction enzyme S subunit
LYLYLSVKDEALNVLANGTTFKELSTYQFMNFTICLPSKKEQSEVINFLESKIFKFQKMTKLLTLKIDRVKEYRQALISSVVTGKVRVTEAML